MAQEDDKPSSPLSLSDDDDDDKESTPSPTSNKPREAEPKDTSPSYTAMIAQAIIKTHTHRATLSEIYDHMERSFETLRKRGTGWRNCVRHTLSLNECFIKLHRPENGRSCNWAIHPNYYENFCRGDFRKRRLTRKKQRASPWQESGSVGGSMHYADYLRSQENSYANQANNRLYSDKSPPFWPTFPHATFPIGTGLPPFKSHHSPIGNGMPPYKTHHSIPEEPLTSAVPLDIPPIMPLPPPLLAPLAAPNSASKPSVKTPQSGNSHYDFPGIPLDHEDTRSPTSTDVSTLSSTSAPLPSNYDSYSTSKTDTSITSHYSNDFASKMQSMHYDRSMYSNTEYYPNTEHSGYRVPTTEHNGYRVPTTEQNGLRTPNTEQNGLRTPDTEHNGFYKPNTADSGYRAPTTEDNGYRVSTTEHNGYRAPNTEHYGYRAPSDEPKESFSSMISEDKPMRFPFHGLGQTHTCQTFGSDANCFACYLAKTNLYRGDYATTVQQ